MIRRTRLIGTGSRECRYTPQVMAATSSSHASTPPSASSPDSLAATDPLTLLEIAVRRGIVAVLGDDHAEVDPLIRPSANPKFGDYQANFAMGLAKQRGERPRDLAQQVVEAVELSAIAEPLEVAGPGFINITLKPDAVATLLASMDKGSLGILPDPDTHPVAIDLCGVNVAKQMHVGHLRSTIIGDALARIFERRQRTVYRENHLGDWGLPIAMVLHQLRERGADWTTLTLPDLDAAYRDAQLSARADMRGLAAALDGTAGPGAGPHRVIELEEQNAGAHAAVEAAKATLLRLQQGDAEIVTDWEKLIRITLDAVYESFEMLNVKLGPENNRGESFYRDKLPSVVDAFVRESVAEEDEGALVVRFDDRDRPLLIRKSDGGYLYATTDLAAIRYRVQELGADRVIYVVDARQRDHFRDVFDAARKIGWNVTPDGRDVELVHIPFGSVLGKDKKPLRTRSGENVTLRSLLVEAVERGRREVRQRAEDPSAPTHGLSDEELDRIGRAVGIGAVKYADLSSDLVRDYVFDIDRMVTFEGSTGPYMQYAHARVCSIFARGNVDPADIADAPFHMAEDAEKQLAITLLRYGNVVAETGRSLEPHRLCTYLYELAEAYSTFYQHCPVIKHEDDTVRRSRLRLCDLTRRVLADGLDLLGIEAPPRM